jgi:hypothetical protein
MMVRVARINRENINTPWHRDSAAAQHSNDGAGSHALPQIGSGNIDDMLTCDLFGNAATALHSWYLVLFFKLV